MNMRQDSTRQKIKHLMSLDQRFRDDDRYLILKIWESEGLILTKEQRIIYMSLPSAAIIVRRRQEFSKIYPASPEAQERRYKHYKAMTNEFSKQHWLIKLFKKKGIV